MVLRGALSGRRAWLRGIKDSKQLTEKAREAWFEKMKLAEKEGWLAYAVVMGSAREIDRRGIVPTISRALARAIKKLGSDPRNTLVLLDGGLRAPAPYLHQKTIIRGDEKEPTIALASIAAKVTRDRMMKRLAKKHPGYGLEVHKGYGTAAHRQAVRRRGLSAIHRKSFCKGLRSW
ncbi:MAG: hypothetical protein A2675_00260 [Candidatus Yonathbacteria bacterium RIFCSPHIGHO2_01_FULL_51_10]|uniref:Ribonuclease n=1 Tax=Candidatus Yonathbacteria bacterium RIFCSPHIGHO2_01_FULL_51_10 TaxID=1802723 RepID=A0A1G2S5D5_9BACT|nr:MAG: hypothetical protein A2675_00260 [Candidatus Yonathbacteria bacterium RIFCSPHIGHO2_01_FULL_51_10]